MAHRMNHSAGYRTNVDVSQYRRTLFCWSIYWRRLDAVTAWYTKTFCWTRGV